jgi:L-2-hydroxyglutarate oxidase LhgO
MIVIHVRVVCVRVQIAKMERTQQQAQQNSVDMVENSSARTIFTKLLNVVLAILAVILVLISTAVNVAGPCLKTRSVRGKIKVIFVSGRVLCWV